MRYLLGAALSALALAFAAVGIASPQFKQAAKLKYTKNKGRVPAGLVAAFEASDPGASPPGNLPGATKVVIKFKGAKVNTKAGKRCTEPRTRAALCPANTRIDTPGSGTADANLVGTDPSTGQPRVSPPIHHTIRAYLHTGGIYFVVQAIGRPTTVILDSSFRKNGTLTANVARDTANVVPGNKLVLRSFKVKIRRITKKVGRPGHGKRTALIQTPKCGSGHKFKITTRFTFDDGTTKSPSSTQTCRK